MTSRAVASPCTRLGGACQTLPRHFSLSLNSPSPRPLSAVSRHPHIQSWIVISSPPQNNALSYVGLSLLSLFSCLGHKFPLSSVFHIPFRCLDQPHLARDGQTSPITSSNPISDPKIPAHLPHGSCFVSPPSLASSFNSPRFSRLASLSLPRSVLPALKLLSPSCARDTLPITTAAHLSRAFVRYTDTSDRFKPRLPGGLFIPMHMLNASL